MDTDDRRSYRPELPTEPPPSGIKPPLAPTTPHTNLGREAQRWRVAQPEPAPPPPEDAIDRATARRLYAAAALTGLIASTEFGARWPTPDETSYRALAYADALIAAERQTGHHDETQE